MLFRPVFALAFVASAFANPLFSRQDSNTNAAIDPVVSKLSVRAHDSIPTILTLQANQTASDATIGPQINDLIDALNETTTSLQGISPSSGSNDTDPTNDDLSVVFGGVVSLVASGLSGLTTATVPSLNDMFGDLDPALAASITAFNTTAPQSFNFVHILMLDASQFLRDEGLSQSLTALGFTA
ncbi:hypothetical protein K435DRAFT_718394 [Dendrothele bispora CBS 962.96]|uniref:Uncharacterized protein n=1 Tax=Dendrothele bispora (strain CBS 962.96) TaxID=1314807 RepID=A0A4S8MEI7_DENBC|nr:hypothetical protein K435DRAFT_718394 [Dendrothele bispora CBS 962.96]